jgi:hypothetical protein
MNRTSILAPLAALAAIGCAPAMDQTDPQPKGGNQAGASSDPLATLPEEGQRELRKEAAEHDGRVVDVDRKSADGSTYFVAKLENPDHSWKITLSEQGRIVDIQEPRLSWQEVPKPVRDAALQQMREGEMITKSTRTRRDGQELYKLDLEKDGQGRDLAFDASGKPMPATKSQGGSQSGSPGTGSFSTDGK